MAERKYGFCTKCNETFVYMQYEDGDTDIDRGEFLVHHQFMGIGYATEAQALSAMEVHAQEDLEDLFDTGMEYGCEPAPATLDKPASVQQTFSVGDRVSVVTYRGTMTGEIIKFRGDEHAYIVYEMEGNASWCGTHHIKELMKPATLDKSTDDDISQPAPASEDAQTSDAHYWQLPHIERIRNDARSQRDTIEQIAVEQDAEIADLRRKLEIATAALEQLAVEPKEPNVPTDYKLGYYTARQNAAAIAKDALAQLKKDAPQ